MHRDMIGYWAKVIPDAIALVDNVEISYRTFDLLIDKVAAALAALSLKQDSES